MDENNIVDLRRERERREREQREALQAVVSAKQPDQEARDSTSGSDQSSKTDTASAEKAAPPQAPHSKELLAWEAPEYIEHPKQKEEWTRTTWLIATPIALLLLLVKNVLGAATIAIGAFAFLVNAFRPPRRMRFALEEKGVRVGERFHPYDQLESFWIFSGEEDKVLSLRRKAWLHYGLHLPIADVEPDRIREALSAHIPEKEESPSVVDEFLRRIGY